MKVIFNFQVINENLETMKKQSFKKTMTLRKKTISTFESNKVTGGWATLFCTAIYVCIPK
jgi:hypothetical protein